MHDNRGRAEDESEFEAYDSIEIRSLSVLAYRNSSSVNQGRQREEKREGRPAAPVNYYSIDLLEAWPAIRLVNENPTWLRTGCLAKFDSPVSGDFPVFL